MQSKIVSKFNNHKKPQGSQGYDAIFFWAARILKVQLYIIQKELNQLYFIPIFSILVCLAI